MILNGFELHNVSDVEQLPKGSRRLYRFPRTVREAFAVL